MASLQPSMHSHDDLAVLFSRNLNFNHDFDASSPTASIRPETAPSSSQPQPRVYSVSQHYTHSAHLVRPLAPTTGRAQDETQRPSSEPSQSDAMLLANVLRDHGVDGAALTASQLDLFRAADEPQQLRLMELWSICPPSREDNIPALAWSSTSLEQEEHLARIRYERMQQNQTINMDTGSHQPVPIESEPYMASGYAELMRREKQEQQAKTSSYSHFGSSASASSYTPATDPVYLGPSLSRQQQEIDMATQYGAFEYFRSVPEMETMDVM